MILHACQVSGEDVIDHHALLGVMRASLQPCEAELLVVFNGAGEGRASTPVSASAGFTDCTRSGLHEAIQACSSTLAGSIVRPICMPYLMKTYTHARQVTGTCLAPK